MSFRVATIIDGLEPDHAVGGEPVAPRLILHCILMPANVPEGRLGKLNAHGFQALAALGDVDNDALPLVEARQPGARQRRSMRKRDLAAAVARDKAEPLHCVVPLYRALLLRRSHERRLIVAAPPPPIRGHVAVELSTFSTSVTWGPR
jgi:hypothetical protein